MSNQTLRGTSRGSTGRTWRVPPAIEFEPDELLPGSFVLTEVAARHSSPEALLVWQLLRDVTLVAAVPEPARAGLFVPDSPVFRTSLIGPRTLDPRLTILVERLAAVLAAPAVRDNGILSELCLRMAHEAEREGLSHTAVAFAQAASFANPADAVACLQVGRSALILNHPARAESWLYRAIGVARRSGDWGSYTRAWYELGQVAEFGARWRVADIRFGLAARSARRHNDGDLLALARYGLSRTAAATGDWSTALRHAMRVLRHWKNESAAWDVRLDLVGVYIASDDFEAAERLLRTLESRSLDPGQLLLRNAYRAHVIAARRSGDVSQAWHDVWPELLEGRPSAYAARAAGELSRAMALVGDTKRFKLAADLAERLQQAPRRVRFLLEPMEARAGDLPIPPRQRPE